MRYLLSLLTLVFLVAGCTSAGPRPGSAGSVAAGDQARAQDLERQATDADVKAAAERAKAAVLEETALRTKTKKDIDAAAAAQATATIDTAIAEALSKAHLRADAESEKATARADLQAIADAKAAEALWFLRLCQISGASLLVLGIVIGSILAYVEAQAGLGIKVGLGIGGIVSASGFALAFFGAAQPWLLPVGGAALLAGLIIWGLRHHSHTGLVSKAHDLATAAHIGIAALETKVMHKAETVAVAAKADVVALESRLLGHVPSVSIIPAVVAPKPAPMPVGTGPLALG